MKIVVFSGIFGGYDAPRPPAVHNPDLQYVLLTDKETTGVHPYKVKVLPHVGSSRKTARYYKIMAGAMFPDADITVWHDGWLQLQKDPMEIIAHMRNNDIAMESHLLRDCVYQEAAEVIKQWKVADPKYPNEQMAKYRAEGMPERFGLTATYMIVRRNTAKIRELEEMWWGEVSEHCDRDQLSFMYCCWKLGIECDRIPIRQGFYRGHAHTGPYFGKAKG